MSASSSSGIGTEPQAGTASAGPAPTSALTSLDIHKVCQGRGISFYKHKCWWPKKA